MMLPLLFLLIFAPVEDQAIGQKIKGQWVHLRGSWQKDAMNQGEEVAADVLHICDNGKFTWMFCGLSRYEGRISIAADAGLRVYQGTWKKEGASVVVRYRFGYSDLVVWPNGKEPDKSEKQSTISIDKDILRFQDQNYVQCSYCAKEDFGWEPTCN
jgi:hypothetical protein